VRGSRVWKEMIGVDDRTVIEDVEFEDAATAREAPLRAVRADRNGL
jgi:hypothetical protein